MEKLESILAITMDQTQQAPETVGRAWNSILQRMNKISAGKDLEDSEVTLNDVQKVLDKLNISLKDENGILRSSSDVLDEVAERWETWNKNQQSQVATALAGEVLPEHTVMYELRK